jgi:hypothetical protein
MRRFVKAGAVTAFVAALSLTSAPFQGDSAIYVRDALNVGRGGAPFSSLWEFGHLLWRPILYGMSRLFRTELQLAFAASLLSILFAIGCILLFVDFLYRAGCTGWGVAIASGILILGDAFLGYSQTATSYIPALFFLVFALWWAVEEKRRLFVRVGVAGVSLFLMVGLWFPFVFAVPAAVVAAPVLCQRTRWWREAALALLVFVAVAFFGFGFGAYLSGCRHSADLANWVRSSSHGWEQNRRLLRAVSGCARLLIDLGFSGVLMKRFAFHDPLNPVRFPELITRALLPVGLFWAFVAGTVGASVTAKGRPALIVFLTAAAPLFLFATALLEPSSPERFLPVLPFLLLLVALLWREKGRLAVFARVVAVVFCCLLPVWNAPTFLKGSGEAAEVDRRLDDFRKYAQPADEIVSVTISDPIASKALMVESLPMVDVGNAAAAHWRELFAAEVLSRWKKGIDVWVQKCMFLTTPPSATRWVEGDDPQIHWREIPAFLGRFEYDRETASPDGFRRIARSEGNRAVFAGWSK